uniref:maturase-related n=1 Tax=Zygnema cf. cylindricum TaxID=3142258 RepID=UPI0031F41875
MDCTCIHKRLTVVTSRVRIIRTAIWMVLEHIYERQFLNTSHGFRPGRGSHSALQQVKTHWRGVSWFIKLDLQNSQAFGTLDLNCLIAIMNEQINDPPFLDLLHQLFSNEGLGSPYTKQVHSTSCSSLRSELSGLLCNIYLHKLDLEVDRIRSEFETNRKTRRVNPEYKLVNCNLRRLSALDTKGTRFAGDQGRAAGRRLGEAPDFNDPHFIRVRYVRYGKQCLLGIAGPAALVKHIRNRITDFLQSKLRLPIGLANYTHINSGKVVFLGVRIHGCSKQWRKRSNRLEKQRRVNKRIRLVAAQRRSAINTKLAKLGTKVLAAQLKKLKAFGDAGSTYTVATHKLAAAIYAGSNASKKQVRSTEALEANSKKRSSASKASCARSLEANYNNKKHRSAALFCLVPLRGIPSSSGAVLRTSAGAATSLQARRACFAAKAVTPGAALPPQKSVALTSAAHLYYGVQLEPLQLSAPVDSIIQKLRDGGIITQQKARPAHVAPLSNATDEAIVKYFAGIARGLLNYYRCCDNLSQVKAIVDYQIRWSALFTLANKHKTSAREIIYKHSRNMTIADANGNTLAQYVGDTELKSMRPMFLLTNPSPTILDRVKQCKHQ